MTTAKPESLSNSEDAARRDASRKPGAGSGGIDYFRKRRMGMALDKPFDLGSPALKAYRRAARMLRVQPGMRILDAGCGLGAGSYLLAAQGAEVVGVDSAPGAVEWATATYGPAEQRKGGSVRFKVVDLARWEPDEHFDAVVVADVLEHFPRQGGVDLLQRLLESVGFAEQAPEGGWNDGLFLHLPLTDNLIDWPLLLKNRLLLKRLRGEVIDHHGDTTHLVRYSLERALKVIHAAGGSVDHLELRIYSQRLRALEDRVLMHNSHSATSHFLANFITDFDGIILPELVTALRNA